MVDDDGDEQDPNGEEGGVSPKVVGHNIYILCHQVTTRRLAEWRHTHKKNSKTFTRGGR